jgi:hypothetical protein
MIERRSLGTTLGAFADLGDLLAAGAADGLALRSLQLELPLDLRLAPGTAGVALIGDLPQFRTRTAFDPEPARLAITFVPCPAGEYS